jgi:hypothetical protein
LWKARLPGRQLPSDRIQSETSMSRPKQRGEENYFRFYQIDIGFRLGSGQRSDHHQRISRIAAAQEICRIA